MTNAYVNKEGVLVEGDIPALTWKKDALGKNKPTAVSQEAKNDYLLEVLKVQTDRLKWVQGEASTATPSAPKPLPTASPAQAFPELKESVNTDMQELPF